MRKKIAVFLSLVFSLSMISCSKSNEEKKEVNISIAASLLEPMKKIVSNFEIENNIKVNINSGGSGTLKKQIVGGAEVGLFISANERYVDELINEGFIDQSKKSNPITNTLVLVKNNNFKDDIKSIDDLVNKELKIAIGEVSTVPAGEYAKEALINSGVWEELEEKIIFCKDVTAVKTYVERGEVDCGFIYSSDAMNIKDSTVQFTVDNDLHTPIVYTMAPIKDYKESEACEELIKTISSEESKEILKEYGFTIRE